MIINCLLFLSVLLNVRLAYCLGKHYKWTPRASNNTPPFSKSELQGGRKYLWQVIQEKEDARLVDEKNICNCNKDE